jgi:nicotinamidase-related amidase
VMEYPIRRHSGAGAGAPLFVEDFVSTAVRQQFYNGSVKSNRCRVDRQKAGLVVIDLQERLLPVIFEHDRVIENSLRLIKAARILGVPLFATEQYKKGLGPTVPEISSAIPDWSPAQKLAFSACGAPEFTQAIEQRGILDAILCGIEAHVCVTQTCLDLLDTGLRVFVVADAVSSRTAQNHSIGIERMRDAGAVIVSTEMILFELLEKAGTEEFKQILRLVV